jgi:hypothetical protein
MAKWYDPTTWNNPVDWWEDTIAPKIDSAWDSVSGKDAAEEAADAVAQGQEIDRSYDFPDVEGPLGSQTVTRDPVTGKVTVNQSLAPEQQALVSGLYGDAGTSRQRVEDALYQRATSRLDPQWSDREESQRTKLYNMGVTEGDEAYDREMRNLDFARTDAYEQARDRAVASGGAEQTRIINAIMQASNPGLDKYWGDSQATEAGIAEGNIMAQVPSGLDAILSLFGKG